MDHNNAPDSWEQDGNDSGPTTVSQAAKSLSSLNVEAKPFVPGQNVMAKEFVPTWTKPASQEPAKQPNIANLEKNDIKINEENKVNSNNVGPSEKIEGEGQRKIEVEKVLSDDKGGGLNAGDAQPDVSSDEASNAEPTLDDESAKDAVQEVKKPKKKVEAQEAVKKEKDHLNIIFIGHVDAGKSTIGGHIMYLTGMVDKRTLEKYEKEAKEISRDSWYLSWALDTNQEERDKGKTVEVGRAYFETELKHFTILDAPGHKSFVPNMIGGAAQADVAILVISARKGEFDAGFERGGQTREHAMLVKTAGVKQLVILVNKMDTVEWEEGQYNEIKDKLTPYLKKCGFNPQKDITYIPVSGQNGTNLKVTDQSVCPWYKGPALLEFLDGLPSIDRLSQGPFRLPIVDKYKDMGTIVLGKVESGQVARGQSLVLMPNKLTVEVVQVWSDDDEVDLVRSGENVKLKLKNIEEEEVSSGFVLCAPGSLCHYAKCFDAQIAVLEHKSIICAGYTAVMHIHCAAEEVTIKALLCLVDKKGEKSAQRPRFVKQDQVAIVRLEVPAGSVCLEAFKEFPQMGRFTLRDEGKTIAIGKVLKIVS